jgi:hypothetical protein
MQHVLHPPRCEDPWGQAIQAYFILVQPTLDNKISRDEKCQDIAGFTHGRCGVDVIDTRKTHCLPLQRDQRSIPA